MRSYQHTSSIDVDETDVPLVTTCTILPPTTTTMGHRLKWMMMIAGMMLLVAGGAILLQEGSFSYDPSSGSLETKDSGLTTAAAEGLVVATHDCAPCLPATDTFNGISDTTTGGKYQHSPFETCWQRGNDSVYCWTKSYACGGWGGGIDNFNRCVPNGSAWNSIAAKYVNPSTIPYSCGTPCQGMYQD